MPKQKSHKGLLKRIRITGKKKIKHKRSGTGHLLSNKSQKSIHKRRRKLTVSKQIAKKLERVLNLRLQGREED